MREFERFFRNGNINLMQKLTIQNSTIQFLVFVSEQGGNTVDIAFQDGDLWATEKVISALYGIDRSGKDIL